jgi:hypothetical protein
VSLLALAEAVVGANHGGKYEIREFRPNASASISVIS